MATFYLVNSITVGTYRITAGTPIDDAVDDVAAIASVGGVLVRSSNAVVSAAAAIARSMKARGAPEEDQDSVMNAAFDAIQVEAEPEGANLTDAAATIQITEGNWRRLPVSTLSAARVLTVGAESAQAGDVLTVTRDDAEAWTYTIDNGGTGGGTLVVLPASLPGFADLQFDGTDWALKRVGTMG